jgi:hypothetical protein
MKIIAHRGNINGPNQEMENNPEYILKTLSLGYDCEIDVRLIDRNLYLGHDLPQYQINLDFLLINRDKLWIHCKNLEALDFLNGYKELNIFWHETDQYTLTNKGYIWSYIGVKTTKNIICVMPELAYDNYIDVVNKKNIDNELYGVCSDYCYKIANT